MRDIKIKVNNLTVESKKDYYSTLGVDKETSKKDILLKGYQLLEFLSSEDYKSRTSEEEIHKLGKEVTEAMNILTDDKARRIADIFDKARKAEKAQDDAEREIESIITANKKKKEEIDVLRSHRSFEDEVNDDDLDDDLGNEEDRKERPRRVKKVKKVRRKPVVERVVDEEDANEDALDEAKKVIDASTVAAIGSVILLGATILVAGKYVASKIDNNKDDNKQNTTSIETTVDYEDISNTTQEEIETPVDEQNVTEVNEEKTYEVSYDVNSEESIQATTDVVYNNIVSLNNRDLNDNFDRQTVEDLVRYTRDNSVISPNLAYDLFNSLFNNNVDVSMLFQNLESRDYLNRLERASRNIDENNGTYDDEYAAYIAMDNALNNMNPNNFAEVIATRVMCDYSTYYNSMNMARGGADNLPGDNVGKQYIDELNNIHSDIKNECSNIYNKVRNDDPNSLLMQYCANIVNSQTRN